MSEVLVCPLCGAQVAAASSMCLACHLPIRDVAANQHVRSRADTWATRSRWLRRRLFGLLVYGGALWWCSVQLPASLAFVAPGVAAGTYLHVVKGRPWLGMIAFVLLVGVLPWLFWPSMLTELLGGVADTAQG